MNIFNWISFCGSEGKILVEAVQAFCRVLGLTGFPGIF